MVPIVYADATDQWEPWQREYKYGAFYIFPPPEIMEQVDRLRERYDPRSAAICSAHVSLSEPVPRAVSAGDLDELQRLLAQVAPITFTYGTPTANPPWPGVAYMIRPRDRFDQLRDVVHSASLFADAPRERSNIPPHMTIAEFISVDESLRLAAKLAGVAPVGEWTSRSIEYAVPDNHMRFQRVMEVPLDG